MEEEPVTMEMVPVEEGVVTEQPGASEGSDLGSIVYLGRSKEKHDIRAAILNKKDISYSQRVPFVFEKMVETLVQDGASSGILAFGDGKTTWSASPDYLKHQRDSSQGGEEQGDQLAKTRLFADFEGSVGDKGDADTIAMYRVTLPPGGLDPDKWVCRPPPLAPEELYTGPRSDGLLSTDEISGEYCVPGCLSCTKTGCCMIVVPLGANTIETSTCGCCCFPPFSFGPTCGYDRYQPIQTRKPGTNEFGPNRVKGTGRMTFSADGRVSGAPFSGADGYKRSQPCWGDGRKVVAKDFEGNWIGCQWFPLGFPLCLPWSSIFWSTKKALNQDQYEESGGCLFLLWLPLPLSLPSRRYTRRYVKGHPTNGFDSGGNFGLRWYRGPGCEAHHDADTCGGSNYTQTGNNEEHFFATKCPC